MSTDYNYDDKVRLLGMIDIRPADRQVEKAFD